MELKNVVLVGGSGRNVGKTTFCENLISQLSTKVKVHAIKMSSHNHDLPDDSIIVSKSDGYVIVEEDKLNSGKDSSRYLASGATSSYFVIFKENYDLVSLHEILNDIPKDEAVVVEARGLVEKMKFGFSIAIEGEEKKDSFMATSHLFDTRVDYFKNGFDLKRIKFENGAFSCV